MAVNRRSSVRVPVQLVVNQLVDEEYQAGISCDLSPFGLYLYRKPRPDHKAVQLEFTLPGESDSVWAAGEIRFCGRFGEHQGTGIAFTAMASRHFQLIQEWIMARRVVELRAQLRSSQPGAEGVIERSGRADFPEA